MTRLCERPGCSAPADVAYGFDTDHLTVWLDHPTAPGASRAGALCRRHADAMVVPLQWTLDDRREMAPRLFPPRRRRGTEPDAAGADGAGADAGGGAHAPRRDTRRRRPRGAPDDTGQLAFDAFDQSAADGLPAETPLADAGAVDAGAVDAGAVDAGPVTEPSADGAVVDPTSQLDRPATPWQPVFDQHDDLDGLLSARSSLLSRAFRGTPRPTS